MVSGGTHTKHQSKRRLYNPFPGEPSNIGFLEGDLFWGLPHCVGTQSFPAGEDFMITWHGTNDQQLYHDRKHDSEGYLSIHHKDQPERVLWSTMPGNSFISGALGKESVKECRGSFSVHEKAELVLSHQTIEQIQVIWPSINNDRRSEQHGDTNKSVSHSQINLKANEFFERTNSLQPDGDGMQIEVKVPAVAVTGCLYSDRYTAASQLMEYNHLQDHHHRHHHIADDEIRGPFYNMNTSDRPQMGVRYWLFFYEMRKHHLGFCVELESTYLQRLHSNMNYNYDHLHPKNYIHTDVGKGYCVVRHGDLMSIGVYTLDHISLHTSRLDTSISKPDKVTTVNLVDADEYNDDGDKDDEGDKFCVDYEDDIPDVESIDHHVDRYGGNYKPGIYNGKLDDDQRLNRVVMSFCAEEDERFFGFGEQFSYLDMKGRRVPILVQEQGLGRGDQPITAAVNLVADRCGGDWHTTYAPAPYYITSKHRCVFLENYEYSVFDLTRSTSVQIQVHAAKAMVRGRVVYGRSPLELIERYTQAIGRMRELPDWVLEGAIVGMQGGTQAVRDAWEQLKAADVPVSAFWLQDWVGQRRTRIGWQLWWNWEVDEEHYPGWKQLVADLQSQGVQTMTYINPFLASVKDKPTHRRDLFEEAQQRGFLVQRDSSEYGDDDEDDDEAAAYMIPNTSFDAGLLDLTNSEARRWLKRVMHDMLATGVKGWMADFGEALPFDAKLSSGESPFTLHNKYPEMWAQLNREVVEEHTHIINNNKSDGALIPTKLTMAGNHRSGSDLVFFTRAGFRNSPRWSTLFWEGDQMVSWQRHDGIKSAIVGLLSGGLSGFTFNHSDIGGYTTVNLPFLRYSRRKELLLRWMELNAFSTIFRTHEGNIPSLNHQFNSDSSTIQHFARLAKVYKAWSFYRKQLVKEATIYGWPVIRHMFLHYPHDVQVMAITYQQFLVGKEILVAPVVDKGKTYVQVYFPIECENDSHDWQWQHVWTGKKYTRPFGPSIGFTAKVPSPIGFPAVFIRSNSPTGQRFLRNLATFGLLPNSH